MDIDVRPISKEETGDWAYAVSAGFLSPAAPDAEERAKRVEYHLADDKFDTERTLAAFAGGKIVGTYRSWACAMALPGGRTADVSAVTNVTVSATHRRRGLLTRMINHDLKASAERGEAMAILIAAEYQIYGRYGFGRAVDAATYEMNLLRGKPVRAAVLKEPNGRVEFTDPDTVREVGPVLYAKVQPAVHGAIERSGRWWDTFTGRVHRPGGDKPKPRFHALYRDRDGEVAGLLSYTVSEEWTNFQPDGNLRVEQLLAATPQAEAALLEFASTIDWAVKITLPERPVDDGLALLFNDPRSVVRTTQHDFVWARVLDAEKTLSTRTYAAPGTLVLQVTDVQGFAEGRFALTAGEDGTGGCERTDASPDLSLDVATLGSLTLGGNSAVRLAAAGLIGEETPGKVALADLMFRTARAPWCPDWF